MAGKKIAEAADAVIDLIVGAGKAAQSAKKAPKPRPRLKPGEYVRDRQRTAFPGIYDRPDEIARRAAERAAPEDPALLELFGVTRNDLYEMSKTPRLGQSVVRLADNPRGSVAAENIMTDRNRQRLTDTLGEAMKYPELSEGMLAWYNLDPAFWRLKQVSNDPARDFTRMNTYSGMASPGSDVMTELQRGSAARMMAEQGRLPEFMRYGGNPTQPGTPEELIGVPGHPYHPTAHSLPMAAYEETGAVQMKSPKVPPYIQSALPSELGGTWHVPVGDAHFARGVGLADTRRSAEYGASVSTPELQTLLPWWSRISRDIGVQEVPAQGLAWGTFSHATGVDTPVGAPKLELIARAIMRRAKELGVDPSVVRDAYLTGRMRLAVPVGATGLLGMMGDSDEAELEQYLQGGGR